METISLAVKLTREEYMAFYASYRKQSMWTTVFGAMLLILWLPLRLVGDTVTGVTPLIMFAALFLLLLNPVILPFMRKGTAGRRYDASDVLKGALTLTMDSDTLFVRTVCHEGRLPLTAITDVYETNAMMALVFGKELTVYIPKRALTETELSWLHELLKTDKKDLSV